MCIRDRTVADNRPAEQPVSVQTSAKPAAHGQRSTPQKQRPAAQRPAQRPAGQRPAQQRPAGQRPAGRPPVDQLRQAPSEPKDQAFAEQERPAESSHSDLDIADVRRVWPQVLEALKHQRRFTHALISQSAQPASLASGNLTLAFSNSGTMSQFRAPGNIEVLKQSLVKVLGAQLNIQTVVGGSGGTDLTSQNPLSDTAAGLSDTPLQEGVSRDDEVIDDPDANAEKLITNRLGGRLIQDESQPPVGS